MTTFGHRVVVAVADGADGSDRADVVEAQRVTDGGVLAAGVGVMDHPVDGLAVAGSDPDRHLQRVEGKLGGHRRGGAPPDDATGEHVGHERGVHHAVTRSPRR